MSDGRTTAAEDLLHYRATPYRYGKTERLYHEVLNAARCGMRSVMLFDEKAVMIEAGLFEDTFRVLTMDGRLIGALDGALFATPGETTKELRRLVHEHEERTESVFLPADFAQMTDEAAHYVDLRHEEAKAVQRSVAMHHVDSASAIDEALDRLETAGKVIDLMDALKTSLAGPSFGRPLNARNGTLMTLSDFRRDVGERSLIDYDGWGRAVRLDRMTEETFYPSDIDRLPPGTTHVLWFNR